jgi:hypothetical protein
MVGKPGARDGNSTRGPARWRHRHDEIPPKRFCAKADESLSLRHIYISGIYGVFRKITWENGTCLADLKHRNSMDTRMKSTGGVLTPRNAAEDEFDIEGLLIGVIFLALVWAASSVG